MMQYLSKQEIYKQERLRMSSVNIKQRTKEYRNNKNKDF